MSNDNVSNLMKGHMESFSLADFSGNGRSNTK
jgi:hypothetical protein